MTSETFNKIIDELEVFDDLTVALSYSGESMLHPQFAELSQIASKQGFKQLQLATNGTQLNNRMNKVLASCFTGLAVSFHKSPLLDRVIEKTKRLYDTVKDTDGCTMRVNIVAEEFTPLEIDQLEHEMHLHCDGFKVFSMITEDMHQVGGRRDYPFCPCMFTYLAVMWDGEALPCCHILSPGGFTLGNVVDSSVKYVFNGTQYKNLRYGKVEGTPCQNCDIYTRK